MSKVVCDICGTAYAETADQCPICGAAKTENTRPVAEAEGEAAGYAYVKGGRFSQSNVRRQNSGKQELPRQVEERKAPRQEKRAEEIPAAAAQEEMFEEKPQRKPRPAPAPKQHNPQRRKPAKEEVENEQPSNLALIVIVVVLLLAIVGVGVYIALHVINANNEKKENDSTTGPSSSSSQFVDIPCTGVSIPGATTYSITDLSQQIMIEVQCQPANTTDLLSWDYDASVVNVTKNGNQWIITPVGNGETDVTVSCGEQIASIHVVCEMSIPCQGISIEGLAEYTFTSLQESVQLNVIMNPVGTTDELIWNYDENVVSVVWNEDHWVMRPVGSGNSVVTVSCGEQSYSINVEVDLNAGFVLEWTIAPYKGEYDFTFSGYGTKVQIYKAGDIVPMSQITFHSNNEEVATVEDGYVYIWKNGRATITATYGNQTISMIVRATNVDVPAEGQPNYKIYTNYGTVGTDVTLRMGEKLTLHLRDENGVKITEGVTFYVAEGEECISVDENGKITTLAVVKAGTYVYVEYEGYVYKCLVRVYEAVTA